MKIIYCLTDERKNRILKADYRTNSKSGNHTIGKMLIEVLTEGIEIPENREMFANQMFKNIAIKRLKANSRIGKKTRAALVHGGYTSQCMMYEIWLLSISQKMQLTNLMV